MKTRNKKTNNKNVKKGPICSEELKISDIVERETVESNRKIPEELKDKQEAKTLVEQVYSQKYSIKLNNEDDYLFRICWDKSIKERTNYLQP